MMNKPIIFALPGNEALAHSLIVSLKAEKGEAEIRRFPDGESYIKVKSDLTDKDAILVCTLHQPDDKLLSLYFFCNTLKDFGAKKITLIAPYLAYMRQDKLFNPGECITSELFAKLISSLVDKLITIDPHLHRRTGLDEIYSIPTQVLHVATLISLWIKENLTNAVLIGPDSESEQWVSAVAKAADSKYLILEKTRRSDNEVTIKVPEVVQPDLHTPVLVDDIISTGITMAETIKQLIKTGYRSPVCIGVHGIFATNAYERLLKSGADRVITTNTIPHPTNQIAIDELIRTALQ
ncbi:ribose-phosphate pyrophosphokinase [Solitalea lacus]|uniref:ribose-phosphate pyrophosphokinase n=1 Tax=Solitalea lacus TaxID=2911172 RepID=UPI001EDABDC3|nr:ribose-phosphate pyrophosphokinase [Solitalea lacus]UKJ06701.1 ribose-phosphate pyrophosphokinase [Solitalea lacus]